MKRTVTTYLLALAVAMGFSAEAQTTKKLTAAKYNEYGLVYTLPQTYFRIEVEAEQTVKKAGPYYNYSKKYLGTTDVITVDSKSWTLKSVKVTSYGVPQKGNEYLMQFKSGATPYMIVSQNGMPLSINIDAADVPAYEAGKGTPLTASLLENNAYSSALSGELLASGSLAKRAETAANTIYKIRESRTNYAIGEADQMPPDGESLRLVLNELDKQEEALKAMFLGTTQTSTAVKVFDYVPVGEVNKEVFLRISDFNGISNKDDLSGEPLYLSVKIITKGEKPLDEKGVEKQLPKGAVMYNIPGKAQVSLIYDGEEVFSEMFDVAQFGVEYGLDPALFTDKKKPAYMKFHPATGGIMEIGVVEQGQVKKTAVVKVEEEPSVEPAPVVEEEKKEEKKEEPKEKKKRGNIFDIFD